MTDSTTPPDVPPTGATPRRNFYGRIKGKTLRASQKSYLEEDLGPLTLQGVTRDENPSRGLVPLEPWRGQKPLWLEVGFGGGEHLIHQAAQNPGIALLGAEPFVNGIAMQRGKIRAEKVKYVRLHRGDVRDLFEVLPEASLEKVFLNYPDPWPKARHHRRRFVTQEYLQPLARLCAPGAEFRIASDIPDYIRQAREEVPLAGFTLTDDTDTPWQDWLSTRYEQKALREGRTPHYLTYRR